MNNLIFDKKRVAMHHKRAEEFFLLEMMIERLAERLNDIKRDFHYILDLSAKHEIIKKYLPEKSGVITIENAIFDDERFLNISDNKFDLVISAGSMHWINNIPLFLSEIKRMLKPDGLLLIIMPGGETLKELRAAFEAAEMEVKGGISPRISPFIDVRDAGMLLHKAGFSLPVVDREIINISYENPLKLMYELRKMGQGNALVSSKKTFTSRKIIEKMSDYYQRNFSGEDNGIIATIELVTMTAWKAHESQQKPLKRGSAEISLHKALS